MPRHYTPQASLTCAHCKSAFTVVASRGHKARYCGLPCLHAAQKREMVCLGCNASFSSTPYRSKGRRYCSRKCFLSCYSLHGHAGSKTSKRSPEYSIWASLKSRCLNPQDSHYPRYGGRGISVHPDWNHSFSSFIKSVGRRPNPALTLERIDNNGNYEPGNVRWATTADQSRNKRSNRLLSFQGVTLCLTDWAIRADIPKECLRSRLANNWDLGKALTTPSARM